MAWKHGICAALGWPHDSQADIARAWQRIRSRVRDWNDLEPALIGRVEELIDFVTAPTRVISARLVAPTATDRAEIPRQAQMLGRPTR